MWSYRINTSYVSYLVRTTLAKSWVTTLWLAKGRKISLNFSFFFQNYFGGRIKALGGGVCQKPPRIWKEDGKKIR